MLRILSCEIHADNAMVDTTTFANQLVILPKNLDDGALCSTDYVEMAPNEKPGCIALTYDRPNTPERTINIMPDLASSIALTAAFDIADWLYAEAEDDPLQATFLFCGHKFALQKAWDELGLEIGHIENDRPIIDEARTMSVEKIRSLMRMA